MVRKGETREKEESRRTQHDGNQEERRLKSKDVAFRISAVPDGGPLS